MLMHSHLKFLSGNIKKDLEQKSNIYKAACFTCLKHIEIYYHFVCKVIATYKVEIIHLPSTKNFVVIFIKAICRDNLDGFFLGSLSSLNTSLPIGWYWGGGERSMILPYGNLSK